MRTAFMTMRLLVSVAIIAAIIAQLTASISFASRDGTPDTANVTINFFSYFTIDSNTLTAGILLFGALLLLRDAPGEPHRFTVTRAAVTVYMILTGLVYNLLLRESLPQGATVTWSNEVLHVLGPAYLLLDWLFAPGRATLRPRDALPALAFPILWVIFTLGRGPLAKDPYTHMDYWYPYPFINPVTSSGGYASVAIYIAGIAVTVVALAFGLTWTTRRRGSDRAGSPLDA